MMRFTILVILLVNIVCCCAQPAGMLTLSDALVRGANAVVRTEEKEVTIKNLGKVIVDHHFVLTVLNEQGDRYAGLNLVYDKFIRIEKMEGTLFDAYGKKIRSLKKSEIIDRPIFTGADLAVDDRSRTHHFAHHSYPYTVEYEIRTETQGTFFLPSWMPVWGENIAVEASRFTVTTPSDYKLRYKSFNYPPGTPSMEQGTKQTTYSWKLDAFSGLQREYGAPSWRALTPGVILGPSSFMIEDFKGEMTDWKNFGSFFLMLNKDRDILPAGVKAEVARIRAGTPGRRALIDSLYNYLQQHTRYVSVQLGIGGWRPFPAGYVAANGYGDCKALSNYMVALLKEAGIGAYYALVHAGSDNNPIEEDFPSVQFNHVIVCVPGNGDSTWLECTSQTNSMGYLGDFTSNRYALLVTAEGGKMVRTPVYTEIQNVQQRNISAAVEPDGKLRLTANTSYHGLQQDEIHYMLSSLSADRVHEYLQNKLDFGTYEVTRFQYKELKKAIPAVDEMLQMDVQNYATITGRRLFITPNIMTRSARGPAAGETRHFGFALGNGYTEVDSVSIALPPGYQLETIPPPMKINNNICIYTSAVRLENNKLVYERTLVFKGGDLPAARYEEVVHTLDQVYRSDRSRVVLLLK